MPKPVPSPQGSHGNTTSTTSSTATNSPAPSKSQDHSATDNDNDNDSHDDLEDAAPPPTDMVSNGRRTSPRVKKAPESLVVTSTTSTSAGVSKKMKKEKEKKQGNPATARRTSGRTSRLDTKSIYKEESISGSDFESRNENNDGVYSSSSSGDDDDDEDAEDAEEEQPERMTSGGHTLRSRASLSKPEAWKEYVTGEDALRGERKKLTKKQARKAKARAAEKKAAAEQKKKNRTKETTARQDIRTQIHDDTTKRRHTFFLANAHLFLPLLPEKSFLTRIADSHPAPPGGHKVVPYKLLTQQPSGVLATMKPYQLSGLSFLLYLHANGASGLLGDEMGLGKTLQTLALFSYLIEHHPCPPGKGNHRPFLVICPLSVLSSWMGEIKRWTPHLNALRFHGSNTEKARLKKIVEAAEYHVIVTTYEAFEKEVTWFRRAYVWRYIVLDEGHRIKNEETHLAGTLQGLSAEFRLILTGTPLQNNLKELWALLHYLMPEVFTDNTKGNFADAFDLTRGKYAGDVVDCSRRLLELIMLRRMKESRGVELGLPPKKEVVLLLPLTPVQRFWYKSVLTRLDGRTLDSLFGEGLKEEEEEEEELPLGGVKKEEKEEEGNANESALATTSRSDSWSEAKRLIAQNSEKLKGDTQWKKLMNLLMQLRKCCNHPYLLPGTEPEDQAAAAAAADDDDDEDDGNSYMRHMILASSKLILLDKLISELCITQGRKILIFSTFTSVLDLLEEFIIHTSKSGNLFKYTRLDGSTSRSRRNLNIRLFNTVPEYKVMLISTKAGGLGINLTSASDVIMYETDWNPQADLQAQARAHRIGQTQEVTVYRLLTQGTVEEQMMGRIRKKLFLATKVTESMRDLHYENGLKAAGGGGEVAGDGAATPGGTENLGGGGGDDEDEDELSKLSMGQLMSLVRRGAQVIERPETDPEEMLKWDWETMVRKCMDYSATLDGSGDNGGGGDNDARSSTSSSGPSSVTPTTTTATTNPTPTEALTPTTTATTTTTTTTISTTTDLDQLEKQWLSTTEKVVCRHFEGTTHARPTAAETRAANLAALSNLTRSDRRLNKHRTVLLNGHHILKESLSCAAWEAVPTIGGKGDPRFMEPEKRAKRDPFQHQDHCQICYDGGTLVLCQRCPRAYHLNCLSPEFRRKATGNRGLAMFTCPQHICRDCEQNTSNAGGMLYRCRWCADAYCEDCVDFDEVQLLGDELVEFKLLDFGAVTQATYMKCHECIENHVVNEGDKKMCVEMQQEWEAEWRARLESMEMAEAERRKRREEVRRGGNQVDLIVEMEKAKGEMPEEEKKKKPVFQLLIGSTTSPVKQKKRRQAPSDNETNRDSGLTVDTDRPELSRKRSRLDLWLTKKS